MEIRHTAEADLARVMDIYARARAFMAAHGNPHQWGPTNWPPEALIRSDIERGKGYVCVHESRVVGAFFFDMGRDIEPTYRHIEDGTWLDDSAYGVVHRIAADGSVKGKNEGRKRVVTPSPNRRAAKASSVPLRSPMVTPSSMTRPSIWWNTGEWVASASSAR